MLCIRGCNIHIIHIIYLRHTADGLLDRLNVRLTVSSENLFCRHQISPERESDNNEILMKRGRRRVKLA